MDLLEERYPGFAGLNLTAETRAGILKHGCDWDHPVPLPELTPSPSLEAQLADLADEIAYTNHDLDDGLRSGLLTVDMLSEVPLWREARSAVEDRIGAGAPERVLRAQTIRALLDGLVTDVLEASAARLAQEAPADPDALRARKAPFAAFSEPVGAAKGELKAFLYAELYHHPRVLRMTRKAERVLSDLYRIYREEPRQLPAQAVARFEQEGEARAIADYIAGMTDRFALAEHRKLLDPHEPV